MELIIYSSQMGVTGGVDSLSSLVTTSSGKSNAAAKAGSISEYSGIPLLLGGWLMKAAPLFRS